MIDKTGNSGLREDRPLYLKSVIEDDIRRRGELDGARILSPAILYTQ